VITGVEYAAVTESGEWEESVKVLWPDDRGHGREGL
jgi:hypothetical protein